MRSFLALTVLVACAAPPSHITIATPLVITARRVARIIELPEHSDVEVTAAVARLGESLVIVPVKVADPNLESELGPLARELTARLRERAREQPGMFELVADREPDLAALEAGAGCMAASVPCMQQIAASLTTRFATFGTLRRDRPTAPLSLELRLVDVERRVFIRSGYASQFPRTPLDIARAFDGLGREDTTLAITVNVDDATLRLDGRVYARVKRGVATVRSGMTGTHTLVLEAAGYEPVTVPLAFVPGLTALRFNLIPQ